MMDLSGGTVLVSGGAGYVGSHICKALARAGYRPVTYDSLVRGHASAVRWGPLERGDILDRTRLDEVMARHKPAAIVHCAALAYVGESVADPAAYYRNNVSGTLTLLESACAHGIRKIVVSSTCAIYGVPATVPISENAPQQPINPYGASKLMAECILADFAGAYDLDAVALRYFNAAGADPDNEIGETHHPETHLIPLILEVAAGRRAAITVHGSDYATPDGTCVRDYVHVCDLADAHVRALAALERLQGFWVFNLGVGRGHSVREVIAAAERVTGARVPLFTGPRRAGDAPVLVADARKARSELGWIPSLSALDDIVATAWAWLHTSR